MIPSLDIFLSMLIGLFILIALLPNPSAPLVPQPLKRLAEWFNAPGKFSPVEISTGWSNELLLAPQDQGDQPVDLPIWASESSEQSDPSYLSHDTPRDISKNSNKVQKIRTLIRNPKLLFHQVKVFWSNLKENLSSGLILPIPIIPNSSLLVCGVIIGLTAQLLIFSQLFLFGILAYATSATLLIFWARIQSPMEKYILATNQDNTGG